MGHVAESIKSHVGNELLWFSMPSDTRAWAVVAPEAIRRTIAFLRESGGRLATMTGVEVRDGIEVNYHICFDHDGLVITVRALASWPEPSLESVAQDFPGALWIEREIHDVLGVSFVGHPDMRRLVLPDDWPEGNYPLRKGFQA
ncbi:NADH-quinone oxidoreductase subunit C [Candidatus Fermentibacteria bacterium]|nr:NADH-quinone oxidoreductase subunit C [Candidatus Fermentibacteria bacterium]